MPRAGSGASGTVPTRVRSSAAIATGKVGKDHHRRAVFRQAGKGKPDAFDERPRPRRVEPVTEPGKGQFAGGAEPGAHRCAAQPIAGEAFPQEADRALIAKIGELGEGVAAHP